MKKLSNDKIHVNDVFPHVLCINLPERKDRRDVTDKELGKYNIEFEYFKASGPINQEKRAICQTRLLPGETGAFNSHLNTIQYAKINRWDNVLIIEDDIELCPNFDIKFDEAIRKVPENWDMIYFGGNHESSPVELGNGLLKCTQTFAIHCIAVRWSMYDKLIYACENNYMTRAVDYLYACLHTVSNVYAFSPALTFQRVDYSDIQGKVVDYTILRSGYNKDTNG